MLKSLFFSIWILAFLLFGGLGGHYPFGVDPVRFVLPFSVMGILFLGIFSCELKISKSKLFFASISLLLIFGLLWNYQVINKNLKDYSYCGEGSRYQIIQEVLKQESFPLKNKFENYRFGTSRYVFGETINYFLPNVVHTLGYQDAGMLNKKNHDELIKTIWASEDLNKSVYLLDWFGIRYFEGTESDSIKKFENDSRFRVVNRFYPSGYYFTLLEYLDAKKIISRVEYINETEFGNEMNFSWERPSPGKVIVRFSDFDERNAILFKEFYHKSWKAKDINSQEIIEVHKVGPGFMAIFPDKDSRGVLIYQSKTYEDYAGMILTLAGIIILVIMKKKSREQQNVN